MQSQAQRLISLFRPIVSAGVTAFLITSAALPAPAQNAVPPTARQAATMPPVRREAGARRIADISSRPTARELQKIGGAI